MSLPSRCIRFLSCSFRCLVVVVAACGALVVPARAIAQIAVIGNTVDEHAAAPGERYEGSIVVRNLTATPQPVRVYQTDYQFFASGISRFDSAGMLARSNAKWVTTSASAIVIPAMSDVVVTYTVSVPTADSLRGTYWSAIMVEGQPSASPATRGNQVGLGAMIRYAIQLATHLPNAGARTVRLTKDGFTDSAGTRLLDVTVQNAGERAYRPTLWVELYDAAGVLRSRSQQERGLLYPGSSLAQRFSFAALPAGPYKALIFADTGDDTVFAAQYKLTF